MELNICRTWLEAGLWYIDGEIIWRFNQKVTWHVFTSNFSEFSFIRLSFYPSCSIDERLKLIITKRLQKDRIRVITGHYYQSEAR